MRENRLVKMQMTYCVNAISILDGLEEKKKERSDKRKSNENRDRIVAGYSIKDKETRKSWTVIKDRSTDT